MVGITAVYVIATIIICVFNGKSAKATREQVLESQHQFNETKRLDFMPYLQFGDGDQTHSKEINLLLDDKDYNGGSYIVNLKLENIGRGTAKDIVYTYENNNLTQKHYRGSFPIRAIRSDDEQYLKIKFLVPTNQNEIIRVAINLEFNDLLNYKYSQRLEFCFEYSTEVVTKYRLVEHITYAPVLMEVIEHV